MTDDKTNNKTNNNTNDMTNPDEGRMPDPGAPVTGADDPRLTAYALGELAAEDVAVVEHYLEASPEGRSLVEETRAFAGVLSDELAGEDAPSLGPEQRAALTAALDVEPHAPSEVQAVRPVNGRSRNAGTRGAVLRLWLTTAAALVLGVLTWRLMTDGSSGPGDHALAPRGSVAKLDESVSGAKLGKNKAALESAGRRQALSSEAVRRRDEARPASGSAVDQLDQEQLGFLSELGYSGDVSIPAETAEELTLEMYDVRDLVGTPADSPTADYNLLPSGTTEADKRQALRDSYVEDFDDLEHDTLIPGDKLTIPTAKEWETVEEEGPRLFGGQGGGGGGGRVDSLKDESWVAVGTTPATSAPASPASESDPSAGVEVRRAPGGGGGSFSVPKFRSSPRAAGRPVAAAEPSPSPTIAEPETLRAMGYTGGAEIDADEDGYSAGIRYKRSYTTPTGGESYAPIHENPFTALTQDRYTALSTFGIDVDTASYSNARRFLNRNQAPPPDAVRLEEFINAFDYDLPAPQGEQPFSVSVDAATSPWAPRHRLVRIGLQGVEVHQDERPASNLVFLLDVSGSMKDQDKLPLLVASLKMLVRELDENDRVAIVTYASGTRLALPSTSGADKGSILAALDSLTANGSTNASDGIQKAYTVATENFIDGGTNRVLLATDGDFNVGITENGPLETFIADKARSGVFLTVLGFGTGNLKDSKAELLADRGNGNYAYIDNASEAHKVLVREMSGTLVTIAKDVKLQVEFNPGRVAAYRLLGYENRALAPQDFRDDKKDAGEIGAGHSVTALYEIVPVGAESLPGAVELKYQAAPPEPEVVVDSPELLTVNLRYKLPDEDSAHEFAVPFVDGETGFASASEDFRFAAAVASFGMVLRHSAHRGDVDLATIYQWAAAALGEDPHGDRAEFLRLVRNAQGLPGY